jgi:hypothetical protein
VAVKPVLLAFAWFLLLCQDPGETSTTGWTVREEFQNGPQPVLSDESKTIAERKMDELVHSVAFRKAARKAWRATWNGTARYETGFSIDENGRPGELQSSEFAFQGGLSHLRLVSKSNALGTFHIHNNYGDPKPSELDINIAKTTHKMVYVGSRDGLYSVDPDGNVRQVFTTVNWYDKM